MSAICGGCNQIIRDQYLFHVLDKPWHAACLQCVDCKVPQTDSCFYRDGMILCRDDFTRRYGVRCAGCNDTLERQDLVRKARDAIYHVRCFTCSVCQKILDTGEQLFVLNGNRFICKDDYHLSGRSSASVGSEECQSDDLDMEEERDDLEDRETITGDGDEPSVSTDPNSGNEDAASTTKSDENSLTTKRRGPRTTIKAKQLDTLRAAFAATPKPTRHVREQLAQETGLNMRVIQDTSLCKCAMTIFDGLDRHLDDSETPQWPQQQDVYGQSYFGQPKDSFLNKSESVWFQNRRSKERRMKQSRMTCGYRPTRRSRQPSSRDEMNMCCDYMSVDPGVRPNDFYQQPPPGMMPPFFTSEMYVPTPQGATLPLAGNPGLEALVNSQVPNQPHFAPMPLGGPMNALQQLENVTNASIPPNENTYIDENLNVRTAPGGLSLATQVW